MLVINDEFKVLLSAMLGLAVMVCVLGALVLFGAGVIRLIWVIMGS